LQPDSRVSVELGKVMGRLPERPKAIVVVSAHWETDVVTVSTAEHPDLLYDYGGFPPEAYKLAYRAPGSPELAARIQGLLADLSCNTDSTRGWDHGVFIPLMLVNPAADIPVVAMSVLRSQSAGAHVEIGRRLRGLREEGILILGSGYSFHNFEYMFARDPQVRAAGVRHSRLFDAFLTEVLVDTADAGDRARRLVRWDETESGRHAHPAGGAEHLVPLMVAFGAAGGARASKVQVSYADRGEFVSSNFFFDD